MLSGDCDLIPTTDRAVQVIIIPTEHMIHTQKDSVSWDAGHRQGPAVFSAFRACAPFHVCLTLSTLHQTVSSWSNSNPEGPGMKASLHILASFFVDKYYCQLYGLPWWLIGNEYACSEGDQGSIPGSGTSPEKKMATHSSILAWEIPWTEEPGGLQSMGW